MIDKSIPTNYNPWIHLLGPTSLALIIIFSLIGIVVSPVWWEWLTIPITLFIMSNWEWLIHRYWMHQLFKPFAFLFKKHRLHHQLYTENKMEISSYKELYHVLTPFWGIVLVFTTIIPLFIILQFISINVACIFIAVTLTYFILYEWTHASYHLSPNKWIRSNKLISFLSKHHATHHNPKNMVKYNFNVTFPLFDWFAKTYRKPGS